MGNKKISAELSEIMESISCGLKKDNRIEALALGGAYIHGEMDEYSDLDFVVFVKTEFYERVMNERKTIAGNLGDLIQCFTGEHVGEPRLLICLYGNVPVHVDLKFIRAEDYAHRVEDAEILWENDEVVSKVIEKTEAEFPYPDYQWIEDRFWIWLHYASLKLGRGELFEVLEFVSFLRMNVLGPLILIEKGKLPRGVRKIEEFAPEYVEKLESTICDHEFMSCIDSLRNIVDIYHELREKLFRDVNINSRVENIAIEYFESECKKIFDSLEE